MKTLVISGLITHVQQSPNLSTLRHFTITTDKGEHVIVKNVFLGGHHIQDNTHIKFIAVKKRLDLQLKSWDAVVFEAISNTGIVEKYSDAILNENWEEPISKMKKAYPLLLLSSVLVIPFIIFVLFKTTEIHYRNKHNKLVEIAKQNSIPIFDQNQKYKVID